MKYIADVLKIVLGVLVGAGIVGLLDVNIAFVNPDVGSSGLSISYAELAAINLTAATLALGAVAVVVTIAAVFGFQVIRAASVSAAESRVEGDLPDLLDKELRRMETDGRLSRALERAIYSGSEPKNDANSVE